MFTILNKSSFNASLYYFLKKENKNKLKKFFYEKSEISKLVNMKLLIKILNNVKFQQILQNFYFK